MLRDSVVVVVVVVRTRTRAIPLAMITMRKFIDGFSFLSHMSMGLRWVALRAAGAPLKTAEILYAYDSLLAEVSHDEAKWNERRETSAGFRRVVWLNRRPNFWSKLTGFQNRFRLMCNAHALFDCTLTIIEPTVDYGFQEIREFRRMLTI